MTRSEIRFGLVPKEHWSYPDWIDQSKAAETRRKMREDVRVSLSGIQRERLTWQAENHLW